MKKGYCLKLFCLICLVCFFMAGCTTTQGDSSGTSGAGLQDVQAKSAEAPTAVYYDFEDVLMPKAMSIIKERTVVVSTPGFKSGILSLKGRVDPDSLYDFFSVSMGKDNWEPVSRIKGPETIIMVYQKATRCAVITIREQQIYTYVEVGVAPTLKDVSSSSSDNLTY